MEKDRVLVCDRKNIFLKMFKRKFKENFDFSENSMLIDCQYEADSFDHFIYVVYDKTELIDFLKLNIKHDNTLVCLFDKQLFERVSFLEEENGIFLLDASKTRKEIVKELTLHFNRKPISIAEKSKSKIYESSVFQTQLNSYSKTLFFLV